MYIYILCGQLETRPRERERPFDCSHKTSDRIVSLFALDSPFLRHISPPLSFLILTKNVNIFSSPVNNPSKLVTDHLQKTMLQPTCALSLFVTNLLLLHILHHSARAGLLAQPASGQDQPYVVPAFPTDTDSQICKLDLSAELFGGVSEACGRNLDRSRCCPVLAAWLFAAHARSALQLPAPAPAPAPSSEPSNNDDDLPMMPSDSQKCVDSLQSALVSKNIRLPQPNASCDAILCFCGIRLHQISSLSCPAAFNVSAGSHNATPTAAVKNLEKNCRNSSYAGCTKCLGALQKVHHISLLLSFKKIDAIAVFQIFLGYKPKIFQPQVESSSTPHNRM